MIQCKAEKRLAINNSDVVMVAECTRDAPHKGDHICKAVGAPISYQHYDEATGNLNAREEGHPVAMYITWPQEETDDSL